MVHVSIISHSSYVLDRGHYCAKVVWWNRFSVHTGHAPWKVRTCQDFQSLIRVWKMLGETGEIGLLAAVKMKVSTLTCDNNDS